MADTTVRKVESYSLEVADEPGEAYRILSWLEEGGVNLLYFTAYPIGDRKAKLDLVAEDPAVLARVAAARGLRGLSPTAAFMVSGRDGVGRAARVLSHLADARINVHAATGTIQSGSFGLILWVRPDDLAAAAGALQK
jgi:hypothetical protein